MSNYLNSLSAAIKRYSNIPFSSPEKAKEVLKETSDACELASNVLKVKEKMTGSRKKPTKTIQEMENNITLWNQDIDKITSATSRFNKKKTETNPWGPFYSNIKEMSTEAKSRLVMAKKEFDKAEAVLILLNNAKKKLVEHKELKGVEEYKSLENQLNAEIVKVEKYLNDYYKAVMNDTEKGRKVAIQALNKTTGADFKSRAMAKAFEMSYKVGRVIKKPDKEIDESILAAIEVNKTKNDVVGHLAKLIKDPKKEGQALAKKFIEELEKE